ncbi:hypothetical protein DJ568_02125 [Mucilaginibacter hurinus]|uniref:Uncharacterized protein n=1 Tax=Mucilaginibacter hurinus TaxID=2201324 RepID=A0A367GTE0_9SPHI|nr:hypothetical protein [Mucilaginibacter hurinus]RCH56677.1 hypothetical protein DJ568_02125 [Mucilaginibacter hurinus]
MKDISVGLDFLLENRDDWSIATFYSFLDALNNDCFSVSYPEDEENWATVMQSDIEVAFVWKRLPLITVKKDVVDKIKTITNSFHNTMVVVVDSLSSIELKLTNSDHKEYFGSGLNYSGFSANDLWFYSVV